MAHDPRDRVWHPAWPALIFCLVLSAGFAAIAITVLLARMPLSEHLLVLLVILPVVAVSLLVASSKVVLTGDSVVVRNLLVVHRVRLDQICYVTNLARGSVHIETVDGQITQVYAINTPMLALMFGGRSRANDFIEAVEDAALAQGAPIDPGHYRRAIGASKRTRGAARPSPGIQPTAGGGAAAPNRSGGAHATVGRPHNGLFPRRKGAQGGVT